MSLSSRRAIAPVARQTPGGMPGARWSGREVTWPLSLCDALQLHGPCSLLCVGTLVPETAPAWKPAIEFRAELPPARPECEGPFSGPVRLPTCPVVLQLSLLLLQGRGFAFFQSIGG